MVLTHKQNLALSIIRHSKSVSNQETEEMLDVDITHIIYLVCCGLLLYFEVGYIASCESASCEFASLRGSSLPLGEFVCLRVCEFASLRVASL